MDEGRLQTLVKYVKEYAHRHYEDGGWDVVVETYEDSEIAEVLEGANAQSEADALAAFAPMIDVWSDRQANARNEGYDA